MNHISNDTAIFQTAFGRKCNIGPMKDMLESFSVGTDSWKDSPGHPLPDSVRPLRNCKFVSPVKKAQVIIDKSEQLLKLSNSRVECDKPMEIDLNNCYIQALCAIETFNYIAVENFNALRSTHIKTPIGFTS